MAWHNIRSFSGLSPLCDLEMFFPRSVRNVNKERSEMLTGGTCAGSERENVMHVLCL